jgi:hypothetical protein
MVLDNLREGMLRPDVYEPELNPLYTDVLKPYRAVAMLCRVGDPDRKGKVESAIGYRQRTPPIMPPEPFNPVGAVAVDPTNPSWKGASLRWRPCVAYSAIFN